MYLRRLRHEIKQIKSNVFYLCFLFKITPPPSFPPTLPGFAPTPPVYKIKTKIKSSLQLRSVAQLVPVFVPTNTAGQLDVPWLNCNPFGIFHHANCWGITRIHRSPSRPRPSMRPTATFINIHEHLI